MKTVLPQSITTAEEAKKFLQDLDNNGELFHPEDDPREIVWSCRVPTVCELRMLSDLMQQVLAIPEFDPFLFVQNKEIRNSYDPEGEVVLLNELLDWSFEIVSVQEDESLLRTPISREEAVEIIDRYGLTGCFADEDNTLVRRFWRQFNPMLNYARKPEGF